MKFFLCVIAALLATAPAQAQQMMSASDGFDAGLTLPWLFPEQTIALVAAGLFLGQRRNAKLLSVWPVFLLFMGMGLFVPPTTFSLLSLSLTLLSIAFVVSIMTAIQRPTPVFVAIMVAALAGIVEGTASAPGTSNWTAAFGVAAGSALRANLFFVTPYLLADFLSGSERRPWTSIALRIIGSWVAAIAVMMLALLLATPE